MRLNLDGYYVSELLLRRGIPHGFGTILTATSGSCGVQSLHCGRRTLRQSMSVVVGLPNTKQIHSNKVTFLNEVEEGRVYTGDGWMTDKKGIVCLVRTADCLPLLLFEPETEIVAAIHCGWRGIAGHIVGNAISEIVKRGGFSTNIIAAIGPHISQERYLVGEDVVRAFVENAWKTGDIFTKIDGGCFLSLEKAVRRELLSHGLADKNIESSSLCTFANPDKFYSYRRDKTQSARMLNFIYL